MQLPPDLLRSAVTATSSAVANTATTGTLLAAPGVGFRIRLWAFGAHPANTAQAIVNWRAGPTYGVGGGALNWATGATFASAPASVLPGGIVLGDNQALGYLLQSALVSAQITLQAFYTLESV